MARRSETDLRRYDFTRAERGKYLEKARRSFETLVVDKKLIKTLGGSDAAVQILRAVAHSIEERRKRRRAA
jgi:hypothetical protein